MGVRAQRDGQKEKGRLGFHNTTETLKEPPTTAMVDGNPRTIKITQRGGEGALGTYVFEAGQYAWRGGGVKGPEK